MGKWRHFTSAHRSKSTREHPDGFLDGSRQWKVFWTPAYPSSKFPLLTLFGPAATCAEFLDLPMFPERIAFLQWRRSHPLTGRKKTPKTQVTHVEKTSNNSIRETKCTSTINISPTAYFSPSLSFSGRGRAGASGATAMRIKRYWVCTEITWNYQGRALFLSNYCRICLVAGCKQSMSLHWIMQPDPRLSQQRRMRGMHMISRKTQKNICYPRSKHPWRWCKVGAPWHIQTSLEWFWQIPRCICPQLQMQPPWQHDRMSRAKVFQVKASHGNPFSVGLAVQARILVALHPGECTRYHCSL